MFAEAFSNITRSNRFFKMLAVVDVKMAEGIPDHGRLFSQYFHNTYHSIDSLELKSYNNDQSGVMLWHTKSVFM